MRGRRGKSATEKAPCTYIGHYHWLRVEGTRAKRIWISECGFYVRSGGLSRETQTIAEISAAVIRTNDDRTTTTIATKNAARTKQPSRSACLLIPAPHRRSNLTTSFTSCRLTYRPAVRHRRHKAEPFRETRSVGEAGTAVWDNQTSRGGRLVARL